MEILCNAFTSDKHFVYQVSVPEKKVFITEL